MKAAVGLCEQTSIAVLNKTLHAKAGGGQDFTYGPCLLITNVDETHCISYPWNLILNSSPVTHYVP